MNSATITRKFSLIPATSTNKKIVYGKIKNLLVKFRDLENSYVRLMVEKLRKGQLNVQAFSGTTTAHIKANIYDALGFNKVMTTQYKKFELKERVKRCASLYPYECVRNWIIRNEYLNILVSELLNLFNSDKQYIMTFLGGKSSSKAHLKTFFDALKIDAFGNGKFLSYFQISNMIRQIRKIFLSETKLKPLLKERIKEIKRSKSLIEQFLDDCLGDFTRKKRRKEIQIKPSDLPYFYLDRFFARIRYVSTRRARKTLASTELKAFKKKRDSRLDSEKSSLKKKMLQFSLSDLRSLILDGFQEELEYLETTSNISLAEKLFKPSFPYMMVESTNYSDFLSFFQTKLRNKVKERLKELFLTKYIIDLLISELFQIKLSIYYLTKVPEIKKLSIPIIEEAVYRKNYDNLEMSLSFVKREFFKFKINDNKKRINHLRNTCAVPQMPSVSIKGVKLILNLPFEVKKKVDSNQSRASNGKKIEMGVDLGLKHFAVLSVMDRTNPAQPREIIRYFLGQKTLFDMKFNSGTGRFEFKDRFNNHPTNSRSNAKLKLIILRRKLRDLQRKINKYKDRLEDRGITNYRDKIKHNKLKRRLSLLWDRISNINLEIVHLLNHAILEIAKYHGASVIKMENLKWAMHSKKRDIGKFMAFWQTHWFYSQVQEAVKLQAFLYSISFKLVSAVNTSKKCSECGQLRYIDDTGRKSSPIREGKRFSCGNKKGHKELRTFQLDSDLNAARNIALANA